MNSCAQLRLFRAHQNSFEHGRLRHLHAVQFEEFLEDSLARCDDETHGILQASLLLANLPARESALNLKETATFSPLNRIDGDEPARVSAYALSTSAQTCPRRGRTRDTQCPKVGGGGFYRTLHL